MPIDDNSDPSGPIDDPAIRLDGHLDGIEFDPCGEHDDADDEEHSEEDDEASSPPSPDSPRTAGDELSELPVS